MSDADPPHDHDRLAELRGSAKGWHGVQLAALGFIGLCGVLEGGGGSEPMWLQTLAGLLVLVSFACACLGIYFVGKAAWPIYGPEPAQARAAEAGAVDRASAELRRGLKLTFASIALVALATTASWWPSEEETPGAGGQVQVQTASGESVCGTLAASAQAGTLRVDTGSQPVVVELARVASVRPVDGC
jgi:hypothetical protein